MKRLMQVWLVVAALVAGIGQVSAATIADFQWIEDGLGTGDVEFRLTNQDTQNRPITNVALFVDGVPLSDIEISTRTLNALGDAAYNVNPAQFLPDDVQSAMVSFVFEGMSFSDTLVRNDLDLSGSLYSAYGYKSFDYSIPEPAVLSLLALGAAVLARRRH